MSKTLILLLFSIFIARNVASQEVVPPEKGPISKGANAPDVQERSRQGKLSRMDEVDYFESKLNRLKAKIDPNVSGRKALPYRIEHSRKTVALMEDKGYWGSMTVMPGSEELPAWWLDFRHYGTSGRYSDPWDYWQKLTHPLPIQELLDKWIPKYKIELEEKYGSSSDLSPEQLEQQAWHWLIPREKEEIKKLEEEHEQIIKSIRETRERLRLAIKKEELNQETKGTTEKKLMPAEDIKKDKAKAGEDRTIDAGGNGMLVGKDVRLSDLIGCGTMITGFKPDQELGRVSTPCPGLTGGLVATQKDYLTVCRRYEELRDAGRMQAYPHPEGLLPICSTDVESVPLRGGGGGLRGMLVTALCNSIHYDLLANKNPEIYSNAVEKGGLGVVFKYDNNNPSLECFFLSKEQQKSVYKEFKNTKKASPSGR